MPTSNRRSEIVIGLVAALGTELEEVERDITTGLLSVGYANWTVRVSELLANAYEELQLDRLRETRRSRARGTVMASEPSKAGSNRSTFRALPAPEPQAVIYLRVSSKRQMDTAADIDPEGNSIATQHMIILTTEDLSVSTAGSNAHGPKETRARNHSPQPRWI